MVVSSNKLQFPQDDHSQAVQDIQPDLNKGLEFLYTLFACAITAKGTERLPERLRAFGILKPFPVQPRIPWNPILLVAVACAFVLFGAWWTAASLFFTPGVAVAETASVIPHEPVDIARWLLNAFIVHIISIALATCIRIRLMERDKYLSVTGSTNVVAYLTIFLQCAAVSLVCYALLNIPIVMSVLFSGVPLDVILRFLVSYAAFCGA